ncbi:hypothetical protein [Amantichitinum ursilacus]|uniref:Uncharacterized protein n=1 Tax=Amantichitinum ursilacus TaxID=857265 RepID=A0A0N0GPL7_9NEIS|nr:hypothetical protein [Amantichitinum ursilacus]KPC53834.1 hypothetical protein WG78_06905 [Amantichitinum ursilacus]
MVNYFEMESGATLADAPTTLMMGDPVEQQTAHTPLLHAPQPALRLMTVAEAVATERQQHPAFRNRLI